MVINESFNNRNMNWYYIFIIYLYGETHLLDNAFVAAESSYFPQLMAQLFVVIAFAKSCIILVN